MAVLLASLLFIAVAAALYAVWRVRWGLPPESIPRVLAYHKITHFELGGTWVPPRRFAAQLDTLLDAGFTFIDESAFIDSLEGSRICAGREVLLTFDDGYREILEHAAPVLEARCIPALVFLVSSYVGLDNRWELCWPGRRFRHLDWGEIIDLAGRGFSFGSHTCTHRDLSRLRDNEITRELVDSKTELERHLGVAVRSLSYPFGRVNGHIARRARQAGYRAAFTLYPSAPNASIDRFVLRREGVYVIDTAACIRVKLSSGPLFWLEDVKGRAINTVATLTPLLKGAGRVQRRL
jgi:peptidoglycan/xylan/chitin deacetylase (PgdA/CDA1 family)